MSEFTKGSLRAICIVEDDDMDRIGGYDILDIDRMQIIGRAYPSFPPGIILPAEANARLWAASGDLYEACKGLIKPNGHTEDCMQLRAQIVMRGKDHSVGLLAAGLPCSTVCTTIRTALRKADGREVTA